MSEHQPSESLAQPTESSAFTAPENPVTRNKAEAAEVKHSQVGDSSDPSVHRGPGLDYDPEGGKEWGTGRGVRGSRPVNSTEAKESHYAGKNDTAEADGANVDADTKIADVPSAEGQVADAEQAKHGVQRYGGQDVKTEGHEADFVSDLDRKKAEQAAARREVKAERHASVDVDDGSEHRRSRVGNESLIES